jgi:hypothetical protein
VRRDFITVQTLPEKGEPRLFVVARRLLGIARSPEVDFHQIAVTLNWQMYRRWVLRLSLNRNS